MTMHRRLLPYAVAAAGLIPLLLLGALCYRLAVNDVREDLGNDVELVANRATTILSSAGATMRQVSLRIEPRCSAATVRALHDAVYRSLYIRGVELVFDGSIRCNDTGVIDPAIPLTHPDYLERPPQGLHIAPPTDSGTDKVSIKLFYPLNDTGTLVLLINPAMFSDPMQEVLARKQVTASLTRSDGRVLANIGAEFRYPDTEYTVQRQLSPYPVHVTVWSARGTVRRRSLHNILAFMPPALLMSGIGAVSVLYMGRRRLRVDQVLRDALASDEFRVHYQPIHSADGRHCIGAEALIRWQHPQRGLLLPGSFISLAEETGFIVPLTYWVMREVRNQLGELIKIKPDLYVGINLTPTHLNDPNLLQEVHSIFGNPLPRNRLVFEITERQALQDPDGSASLTMRALQESGARLSLDDFGTGHSGLQQLTHFKFDALKIDKSFVDAIGTGSITSGLIIDIVGVARRLKMLTIAEGVEREEQFEYLRDCGVDCIQGWLFSPALSASAFADYLRRMTST